MHAHEGCYSQYSMIFINKTYALTSAQLFTTSLFTEILSCHRNGDLKKSQFETIFFMLKLVLKDYNNAQKQRVSLFCNKSIKLLSILSRRRIIMRKLGKSLGSSNNNRLVCTFTLDNFRTSGLIPILISTFQFGTFQISIFVT